jgi:ABC-type nitrate/sulfonate/bicarbonate transport system ATPase subunit
MSEPRLVFDRVTVRYPDARTQKRVEAVRDMSFRVEDKPGVGELVVFLGPSGCGKSTILKAIAGLLPVDEGRIELIGKPVGPPGKDRGMVFQAYTSFAWLTVRANVEYGLRLSSIPARERREKAMEMLKAVGLAEFAEAFPKALSGGMKQRVAIARTLLNNPKVLLMDEPFGALDPNTRWGMQGLVLDMLRRNNNTVLFVTHDVSEAVYLGDVIYLLSSRPAQILHRIDVPFFADRSFAVKSSLEFRKVEDHLLSLLHESPLVQGNIRVGV